MRYGIFSDIHGNLEAMMAVAEAFKKENVDCYFCVGDVVGYGANPNECVEVVKAISSVCIAGNHDWAVIGKVDTTTFNPVAKEAILWTAECSTSQALAFLSDLELIYKNEDVILVHGTLQEAGFFHYLVDIVQAQIMFSMMDRAVCFVGHSHIAGIFDKSQNGIVYAPPREVKMEAGHQYIVNVGSVGQPRDGDPRACFCVFDTGENVIQLHRVAYDIKEAQRKIVEAGLPEFLAYRLAVGR